MKIFIKISLLILFFWACSKSGLNTQTPTSKKDSIKIKNLIDTIKNTNTDNFDKLTELSQYVDENLKELVPDSVLSGYYNELGLILYQKSNYRFAEAYFNKAFLIYQKEGKKKKAAKELANIGVIKELSGDYNGAIDNYLKALQIFKESNDKIAVAKIFNNIGILYEEIKNYPKAIEYYKKAYALKTDTKNNAMILSNIGVVFEGEKQLDSALFYYQKSLQISSGLDNETDRATILNNIGNIFLKKEVNDSAIIYFNNAKNIFEKNENLSGQIISMRNAGAYYLKIKDYNNAEKYLKSGFVKAKKTDYIKLKKELSKLLAELYEQKGSYKKANYYLKYHYKINDSIFKEKNIKQINRLEARYKLKEKDSHIQILKLKTKVQKKRIIIQYLFISILLITLLSLIIIYYQYRKHKTLEIEKMQQEIIEYVNQLDTIKKHQKINSEQTKKEVVKELKENDLTDREIEVLFLIAEGYSNNEIADKLFISLNTVKFHSKNIFIKLNVKNRVEAARKTKIL